MQDPFVDATTLAGQARIRGYALGWLERLDYSGKLERQWSPDELGALIWRRVESEFAPVWPGDVVNNRPLAEVIAASMVEDYYGAYPERRLCRYAVAGPLGDLAFRRCVADFVDDLDEFAPEGLPEAPERAAEQFWREVRAHPERWGYRPAVGPFVDDEPRARVVVLDAIRECYDLRERAAERHG